MAEKKRTKKKQPRTNVEHTAAPQPDAENPAGIVAHASPASADLLNAVVNALPDIAFIIDEDGCYVEVFTSPTNTRHFGANSLKGQYLQNVVPEEIIEQQLKVLREALATNEIQMLEYTFPNPDGIRWYEGRVAPVQHAIGQKKHVVWLAREITHHRSAKEKLERYQQHLEAAVEERAAEVLQMNVDLMRERETRVMIERMLVERQEYLNGIIDNILAMVYVRSTDNVFTLVSRKYAEFFALPHNDILGNTPDSIFPADLGNRMLENDCKVLESGAMSELEYWCDIGDGRKYVIERAVPLMDEKYGRPLAICGTVVDMTEAKEREDYITHIAMHDALTGLANRKCVMDRLAKAITLPQNPEFSVALLFIDLDFFKKINDTIGHEAGDVVLKETAKRFQTCVGKEDTVGRFGGDEFVIILEGVRSRDDVETVIKRIFAIVGQPILYQEHTCVVGASIGISICPEHATDIDSLIMCADDAMYVVKKKGKNSYAYFCHSDPDKSKKN